MARASADSSVFGASTQVAGRISGDGGLRVEGKLGGDVDVTGPVQIASGAAIEGDVTAASLEIEGKLDGNAKCKGAIAVRAGAEVRGDLAGASVAIEPGSRVDVRLDTDFTLDLEAPRGRR